MQLDAFMSAFGRGLREVQAEDAEIAIKIARRQIVIRRVCFTTEVPDKTGYYLGLLKKIVEKMDSQIAKGIPEGSVAMSLRDFQKTTHAHRDNEIHIFEKAWNAYAKTYLRSVKVKKSNGQEYEKFLPAFQD